MKRTETCSLLWAGYMNKAISKRIISGVLDMMRNKDLTEPEYAEVRTIQQNAAATQPLIAKTGLDQNNR